MHNTLEREPAAPSRVCRDAPEAFDPLVLRALAREPDRRFQSATEFLLALRETTRVALEDGDGERNRRFGRLALGAAGAAGIAGLMVLGIRVFTGEPAWRDWVDSGFTSAGMVRPGPVKLEIISDPPGASITVDGRQMPGVTPGTVALDPGHHTLALTKDGYFDWQVSVEAEAGARISPIKVRLSRIDRR